jgi:hypothetical protein
MFVSCSAQPDTTGARELTAVERAQVEQAPKQLKPLVAVLGCVPKRALILAFGQAMFALQQATDAFAPWQTDLRQHLTELVGPDKTLHTDFQGACMFLVRGAAKADQ